MSRASKKTGRCDQGRGAVVFPMVSETPIRSTDASVPVPVPVPVGGRVRAAVAALRPTSMSGTSMVVSLVEREWGSAVPLKPLTETA